VIRKIKDIKLIVIKRTNIISTTTIIRDSQIITRTIEMHHMMTSQMQILWMKNAMHIWIVIEKTLKIGIKIIITIRIIIELETITITTITTIIIIITTIIIIEKITTSSTIIIIMKIAIILQWEIIITTIITAKDFNKRTEILIIIGQCMIMMRK
jgi:hypothetical protein